MNHDRAAKNLRHSEMGRSDCFGRIAPAINHQHRQIPAMAGGAERPQMFLGVGRVVMATGGKARGRVALIHPRPAVAFFVNMEAVLSGRQPGNPWCDNHARSAVRKKHRPQRRVDAGGTD